LAIQSSRNVTLTSSDFIGLPTSYAPLAQSGTLEGTRVKNTLKKQRCSTHECLSMKTKSAFSGKVNMDGSNESKVLIP